MDEAVGRVCRIETRENHSGISGNEGRQGIAVVGRHQHRVGGRTLEVLHPLAKCSRGVPHASWSMFVWDTGCRKAMVGKPLPTSTAQPAMAAMGQTTMLWDSARSPTAT